MSKSSVEVMKDFFSNFQSGKIAEVISVIDKDAKLVFPGPTSILPWAGEYKGSEIMSFFQAIGESIQYDLYDAHTFHGSGDTVTILSKEIFTVKKTGKKVTNDLVAIATVKGGMVTEFIEYSDTQAMCEGFMA